MFIGPKLKELSFLVYGLGLSGCSVVNFFRKNKVYNFKVWDDKQKKLFIEYRTKNLSRTLEKVDFIVLSPGISLIKNKNLQRFKEKIITDIDLLYLTKKKFKSIVVTGTNGESTTCKLIAHLLKKNRYKFLIGGNIGEPILNFNNFNGKYIIIEASSFQLSHSKFIKPNFAFLLNFSNDHLDWHGNLKNYLNSKFKIFSLQDKKHFAIIDKKFKKKFLKNKFLSKLILPKMNDYKKVKNRIQNKYLKLSINDENMNFVYCFSKLLKIRDKSFIHTMKSFKGLSHRFEIFLKKKDFTFIDDSKATSFEATKTALINLKNIYWILGGLPKKGDRIKISKIKKNIVKCYLIGKNINFFKNQIKKKLPFSVTINLRNSIIQAIHDGKLKNQSEKFILLSPVGASFDQFNNFEERGREFKRLSKIYASKFI